MPDEHVDRHVRRTAHGLVPVRAHTRHGAPNVSRITRSVNEAALRNVFDFSHNGWRSVTKDVIRDEGGWNVRGTVFQPGGAFGGFWRRFLKDDGTMQHGTLDISPAVQGAGFGRRWVDTTMSRYGQLGVKKATVSAVDVGGYVWATLGFRPTDVNKVVDQALSSARVRNERSPEVRRRIQESQELLKRSQVTSIEDLMALGADRPWSWKKRFEDEWRDVPEATPMWAGKLLLIGTEWDGEKDMGLREASLAAVYEDVYRDWVAGKIPGYPDNELPLMQEYLRRRQRMI